jgi:hypothetical protein
MLTDFGFETLLCRRWNNCAFRRYQTSKKDRCDVSPDEIRQCFGALGDQVKSIPSPFVWNLDEARTKCPKKIAPPEVIVTTNMKVGSVVVPEARDETQLTMFTAISASGDSISLLSMSRFRTYEKALLAGAETPGKS